MGPKKQDEEYLKKRREQKKLSMRRAREKLKKDPVKHEEVKLADRQRYTKNKQEGKRKSIKEMTKREQRATRKAWRKYSSQHREKKKKEQRLQDYVEDNTPPESPGSNVSLVNVDEPGTSRARERGQQYVQRRRKNQDAKNRAIKELEKKVANLQTNMQKYKTKYYRLKKTTETVQSQDTPRRKIKKMAKNNPRMSGEVQRSLLFSAVISKQIQSNYAREGSNVKKKLFSNVMDGKMIEKYKFKKYLSSLTSNRCMFKSIKDRTLRNEMQEVKKEVQKFLEQDICSRMAPGKKDCITRKKLKKQKRMLYDTMKNLHQKFVKDNPKFKQMSYTLFCRLRPFWIVFPKVADRDTCACKKHSNMALLISKLKSLKMVDEKTVDKLTETDNITFEEDEIVSNEQWKTVKEIVNIKGSEKLCQKTVKEEITCTNGELVKDFKNQIDPFRTHCTNITNQHNAISKMKENLKESEAIFHFDFSENYNCKYAKEIQSAHFGGSKKQISIHTSVVYTKTGDDRTIQSYCTLSENLRHDPVAICAHLDPVIEDVKSNVNILQAVHFLSDGPVTQYRNKTMFQLWVQYIAKQLKVDEMTWNYTEAGHGKGAPDGVGGNAKRLFDGFVARGFDIPNLEKLMTLLRDVKSSTKFFVINDENIEKINKIPLNPIPAFKGTLSVHQLTWNKEVSSIIQARSLSCSTCNTVDRCEHFGIGQIKTTNPIDTTCSRRVAYQDVYSDDTVEDMSDEEQEDGKMTGVKKKKTVVKKTNTNAKTKTDKKKKTEMETKQTDEKKKTGMEKTNTNEKTKTDKEKKTEMETKQTDENKKTGMEMTNTNEMTKTEMETKQTDGRKKKQADRKLDSTEISRSDLDSDPETTDELFEQVKNI